MILLFLIQILSLVGITLCSSVLITKSFRQYAYRQFRNAMYWRNHAHKLRSCVTSWKDVYIMTKKLKDSEAIKLNNIANYCRVQGNDKYTGKYTYLTYNEIISGNLSRISTTKTK